MRAVDIDPENADDVTVIQQPFDMSLLLNGELDAAQAMTYNEYAQVLEAVNPDTGELYQPEDLNVIDFNDVGTAMLQDHVFVNADWLAEEGNEDIAVAFLKASFRGWIHCRDNPDECVGIVLDNGSTLGESHQTWQLNEISKLIWPSPAGIGIMDEELWAQTVAVSIEGLVISEEPGMGAYRSDLAQAALDALAMDGVDVVGDMWEPVEVDCGPRRIARKTVSIRACWGDRSAVSARSIGSPAPPQIHVGARLVSPSGPWRPLKRRVL